MVNTLPLSLFFLSLLFSSSANWPNSSPPQNKTSCPFSFDKFVYESDEILSRGFKDQIYDVYMHLPLELQDVLASATLPNEISEITSEFMPEPVRILVKRDELILEGTKQFFVAVEKKDWKFDTL